MKVLSSDESGGRAPGTDGEQQTADYVVAQFKALGLQPGNGDSWFQDVPMVVTTADEAGSDMVFVGYGVNAPESGWNDYEGLDVKARRSSCW